MIQDRIKQFIEYKGVSNREFERVCGLGNAFVRNVRDTISTRTLELILQAYPELSRDWLLTGDGAMLSINDPPATVPTDTILIPVVNLDSRGGTAYNEEVQTETYVTGRIPFPTSIAHQGDVVIPIYGDSMEPAYKAGSLVLIREVELWREYLELGCAYVIGLVDDRRIIKTVTAGIDDDHYTLISVNPSYQPQQISKSIIRSVWRVIASVRRESL